MYKKLVAAVLLCAASVECGLIYDIRKMLGERQPKGAEKIYEEIKQTFMKKYGVEYLPEKSGYFNVRTMYKMYLEATVKPSDVHAIRLTEPWNDVCKSLGRAISFGMRNDIAYPRIYEVSTLEVTRIVKQVAAACQFESLLFNMDIEPLYIVPGPTTFRDSGEGREVADYFTYFLLRDNPKLDHFDSVLDLFVHQRGKVFAFPYTVGLRIKPNDLPTQSSTLFSVLMNLPDELDSEEDDWEFNAKGYYIREHEFIPGYFINRRAMRKKKSKGASGAKSGSKRKHERSHSIEGEPSQKPHRPSHKAITIAHQDPSHPSPSSKPPRIPLKTITNVREENKENMASTPKAVEKKHHTKKASTSHNERASSPVEIKLHKSTSVRASDAVALDVVKGMGSISLGKPVKIKSKVKLSTPETGQSSASKKAKGKEN